MSRRALPALLLALTLVACTGQGPTSPPTASAKPKASVRPGPSPSTVVTGIAPPLVPGQKTGILLAGVAKIISEHGGGLISDQGSGIISDHGGGVISNVTGELVSNNGGALVSNNGGGLVSDKGGGAVATSFALLQAGPAPQLAEFLLADAVVTLQDAAGQPIRGSDGQPLQATTDAQGRYELRAELPATSLVARIQLKQGGELTAMLARDAILASARFPAVIAASALTAGGAAAGGIPLDLDTSTSLGAAYVLDQFVKGEQKVFDRLPGSESSRLAREITAARDLIAAKPAYTPTALVGLATTLRDKSPAVAQTFEDIKIILLGQADLGGGRPATEVSLGQPGAMAITAKGELIFAEGDGFLGRIRRVGRDGLLTTYADSSYGEVKTNFPQIKDLAAGPDGSVYVAEGRTGRVYRIRPDGTIAVIAGNGLTEAGDENVPGEFASLYASRLEVAPDGLLFIGDGRDKVSPSEGVTRLLLIDAAGKLQRMPISPTWVDGQIDGLAIRPDGSFDVLHRPYDGKFKGLLYHLARTGAWTLVAKDLAIGRGGDLARGPDGTIYVIEQALKRVVKVAPDGTKTPVAGVGAPVGENLVQPSSVAVDADGVLYVADDGTGLVSTLAKDGTWRTLAGRAIGGQKGSYEAIAISAPGGVAFDAQGRLLFADGGTHTIRRLDGDEVTIVAGSTRGRGGDGGPALEAQLDGPTAIAYKDGELWILDSDNSSIRKVTAEGTMQMVIGSREGSSLKDLEVGETRAPNMIRVKSGVDFTFDKDGLPVWTDVDRRQILRLRPDGIVEQVAGKPESKAPYVTWLGDGSKALDVSLDLPTAVIFDRAGDLLIADPLGMAIRKVRGYGTANVTIETFAGSPILESIRRLSEEPDRSEEGILAKDATMRGPAGMCYDAAGNLYLAETGTTKVGLIAGTLTGTPIDTSFLPPSAPRIRKITPDGRIFTVAGPGGKLLPDPIAPDALVTPWRLAIDPKGRMVVVDVGANQLRFFPAGSF